MTPSRRAPSWSRPRLPSTISEGSSCSATRGSQASSTSNRPSWPRCSSSAVATPQVMFEPARLWTGWRPSAARTPAIIPAVVVLPLVALTIVVPRSSPVPRRAIASGSRRSRTRPGRVVPPPRPLRRLAAPIARESASLAPNRGRVRVPAAIGSALVAGRDEDREAARQHPQRDRQVGEVVAVGVDREGAAGVELKPRGAEGGDLLLVQVSALQHLAQPAQEAQLADLGDRDDVELAVVDLRLGSDVHAAAVDAVVGDVDEVAGQPFALAAGRDREAGRTPADQGADHRVGVDEVAADEVGLVGEAVAFGVEADADDAEEALAVAS